MAYGIWHMHMHIQKMCTVLTYLVSQNRSIKGTNKSRDSNHLYLSISILCFDSLYLSIYIYPSPLEIERERHTHTHTKKKTQNEGTTTPDLSHVLLAPLYIRRVNERVCRPWTTNTHTHIHRPNPPHYLS